MATSEAPGEGMVLGGVDTHKDVHAAARRSACCAWPAVGAVGRAQTIEIHGTALRLGQTCVFRLFYADKRRPVIRDIVPDEKKRCTASVTIPDRPGVVGDASVVLLFTKTASGKKDGSA